MRLFPDLNINALWRPQTISDLDKQMDTAMSGVPTFTGVNISENLAMNYTAVYACVRVRSETFGSLSAHLMKRHDKGADKATNNRLYYLIHDAPNEEMSSAQWRMAQESHLDTWGNLYAYIERPVVGRNAGYIKALHPLKPDKMKPYRDENKRIKYEYKRRHANGTEETLTYDMSQILHVAGMGYDGVMGYSPIRLALQSVGLGMALEEFVARFFGQGAHVKGVIMSPDIKDKSAVDRFRESVKEAYAGLQKAHQFMVLPGATDFKPFTMPLQDAELLASRKFQLEEIARIYRVPLHMVQNLDRATFSNIEHMALEFAMYTMLPICKLWEQAMNLRLLTESERQQGYYFQFDLKSLMRGDMKTRGEWYKMMIETGAYNPNKILKVEDENLREDEYGDAYLVGGTSGQRTTVDPEAMDTPSARALRPVLLDAAARIMKRENRDIAEKAEKWASNDMEAFSGWLGSYWDKHTQACIDILKPVYSCLNKPEMAANAAQKHVETLKDALRMAQMQGIDGIKACLTAREPQDMPLFGEVA